MNSFNPTILLSRLALLVVFSLTSGAADVVLIADGDPPSPTRQMVEQACALLGVSLQYTEIDSAVSFIDSPDCGAVMIAAATLSRLSPVQTAALRANFRVPVLVLDPRPGIDDSLLQEWSGGAITASRMSTNGPERRLLHFAIPELTFQLSGQSADFWFDEFHELVPAPGSSVAGIIVTTLPSDRGQAAPLLASVRERSDEIFFLTRFRLASAPAAETAGYNRRAFIRLAPALIFLRRALGERCWHAPEPVANMTIDDPWLTEPFGSLSFEGLLDEMEKAGFHTTIAFIPWNFDRGESKVINLFKDHSRRYSLCVHGNNHDHREFYKYETSAADPWPAAALADQEHDIVQAVARMDELARRTELSYDRVMVFPHSISPAKTLGLLKKHAFLMTVNGQNVPLGEAPPDDPLFHLRPVTLAFEGFPSVRRFAPNRDPFDIAIDMFLGNPLLFYTHHADFQSGHQAFNGQAAVVNRLDPETRWTGLGDLAHRLYLQKRRTDGSFELQMASPIIDVRNPQPEPAVFRVRKQETFEPPVAEVLINGESVRFERTGQTLAFETVLGPEQGARLEVVYVNDWTGAVSLAKNDSRVNRLRAFADFRDLYVSRYRAGRFLTRFYYASGLYQRGLKSWLLISAGLSGAVALAGFVWFRRHRARPVVADPYNADGFSRK